MFNMEAQKKERRPRRTFSPEFKAEVIAFCRQPGHGPALAAKDFDLTESAVRSWLRQDDVDNGRRGGMTTQERDELTRLRKEVRTLREERDILKRATAFFAKETR
jgi:transposase